VAHGILLFLMRWIIIGISRDIEFDLRNNLFAQLEKQSASYYHDHRTGDIMARMTTTERVRMLLGPAIMYTANTVLFLCRRRLLPPAHQPHAHPHGAGPMPLASILIQFMGRRIHDRFERIQAMFSDISAQAQENFSGARLVRAFAQEEAQVKAFERSNREYIRRALRLVRLMGMLWPTLEFMLGLAMVISLLVGGHLVLQHRIPVGAFVAFTTYMLMLTWPIIALGYVVNLFERGTASVVRIHELLTAKPAIDDHDAVLVPEASGSTAKSNFTTSTSPTRPRMAIPWKCCAYLSLHPGRQQSRSGRPDRLRQIHAGQPHRPPLRRSSGKRPHRWPAHPRLPPRRAARRHWLCSQETFLFSNTSTRTSLSASLELPPRRLFRPLRRRTFARNSSCSPTASKPCRRARAYAVRRPEAAHGFGSGDSSQSPHPDPRRRFGQRRHLYRRADPR